jgi:hypothetical protein
MLMRRASVRGPAFVVNQLTANPPRVNLYDRTGEILAPVLTYRSAQIFLALVLPPHSSPSKLIGNYSGLLQQGRRKVLWKATSSNAARNAQRLRR